MVGLVLRVALGQLSDTFGNFAGSMLSIPNVGPILRRTKNAV
jgi:hypothetical protein